MKFCGIDWANNHHDALSIDEAGRQLGSIRVAHRPERLSQLDTYLERIAGPGGREQIACIVETTHGLLIAHLLEQGWAVYPVNPRTVEKRRAPSGASYRRVYDPYLQYPRVELFCHPFWTESFLRTGKPLTAMGIWPLLQWEFRGYTSYRITANRALLG